MEPMPSPARALTQGAPGPCPADAISDITVGVLAGRPSPAGTRNPVVRFKAILARLWRITANPAVATGSLGRRAVLTVPGRREQVSEARAFARRLLGYQHSCVDTVVLLLSELVTNSVLHSRSAHTDGRVTIAITHSRTVVFVEVTDDGSEIMPSLRPADGRGEHGYGLQLVEASAARWGCSRNGTESTTCWFEVRAGA
jgi:anti-sigma regulatory factor (Ser/Thr protein kinase)